jgi:SAM-dependent methyltransferase
VLPCCLPQASARRQKEFIKTYYTNFESVCIKGDSLIALYQPDNPIDPTSTNMLEFNEPITWKVKYKHKIGVKVFDNPFLKQFIFYRAPRLRDRLYDWFVSTNERIVENPWVHSKIKIEEGSIIDVGCYSSKLPLELASLGLEVWGIDVRRYQLTHPNFSFVQGNICNSPFPSDFFDTVIAVSVIEHMGRGDYGDPVNEHGESDAMEEIHRILRNDGTLMMSVPFGKKAVGWWSVYDLASLKQLLSGFEIKELTFIKKEGENWRPASVDEVENVDSAYEAKAVALILAQPKKE